MLISLAVAGIILSYNYYIGALYYCRRRCFHLFQARQQKVLG